MDEVVQAVENLKKEWDRTVVQIQERITAIEGCGKSGRGTEEANSLPRLNGAAQDGLTVLRSMQFRLDLLSQQLPTIEESQSANSTLELWKKQYQNLHMSLRNANLQAKNNIRKAAQEERELLLGGGEESTIRRRNLQTKAGITSAAESITESLRRTRQLMVQEVERSANTLGTFEESTSVLTKAEGEYKGHRSLLMRTRRLLSTMQRQDIIDRVILVTGLLMFLSAVLYVVWKRVGLLKLQRKLFAAIKAGSKVEEEVAVEIQRVAVGDGLSHAPAHGNTVPLAEIPGPHLYEEL
ncbi:uncharacterized protein LOC103706965 [Phoenix dactylifera]|uniref:Uncharacterized protein LOC103706965 n=1 Tax=Phoenix dactylifera TaxID=42345 RepID=A0A8B7C1A2_PHODC|nr:uncharacterized protein LOC103706965 [Phoenix dactylifera]XP_008789478.2 uncharacterized protein LOC103706965 [Phoenix dactylifera]XP_038971244.1 uncharacterized protein LOC103706965 [Phoenix dactylifera]